MREMGLTREFIQHLIFFNNERVYFGTLDRDDQLNLIARALHDKVFDNLEIFSLDKEMLSKSIQDAIKPAELIDYIKEQMIQDYELYLDELIDEEYEFLGYYHNNIVREVDMERVFLADDLRRERNQKIYEMKFASEGL